MITRLILEHWQTEVTVMIGEIGEKYRRSGQPMPDGMRDLQQQLQRVRIMITDMLINKP